MAGVPLEAKLAVGILAAAGVAYLVFTQSGGSDPATGSIAAAAASGGPTGSGPTTTFGVLEEDAELGIEGAYDWLTGSTTAASTYASINGLNAQQTAAVTASEPGVLPAAASATADQLTSWGTGLLVVAGVGAALFAAAAVAPYFKGAH